MRFAAFNPSEQFEFDSHPSNWFVVARDLWQDAEDIRPVQLRRNGAQHDVLGRGQALLISCALECMVKAVLVKQDPSLVSTKVKGELASHDLVALVASIKDATFTSEEIDTLRGAHHIITGYGRYPIHRNSTEHRKYLDFVPADFSAAVEGLMSKLDSLWK